VEPIIEGTLEVVLPGSENANYTNENGTTFGWGANCVSHSPNLCYHSQQSVMHLKNLGRLQN